MSFTIFNACNRITNERLPQITSTIVRCGHWLRGKAPGEARTLQQRLTELHYKNPNIHYRVDIGFPLIVTSRNKEIARRRELLSKQQKNTELEKLARNHKLQIDLNDSRIEWMKTTGPEQIKTIADHYGIFNNLFGDAYFVPRVPMDITYPKGDPVYYGNVLKPADTTAAPAVGFDSEMDTLWTLIMTNPDGHLTQRNAEYVHWFIGNIPGNALDKGEVVYEYLQPFPPKGSGYHRHIFVLYKQQTKLDFAELKKRGACLNLAERTFSTLKFYQEKQDVITPAGLAFFQSDWDSSLTDFYHNKLNMKEPIFEYDFPPPYIRPQKWFPLRQPFNLYMDKYRDPKQVSKEFLLRKLKDTHPFDGPRLTWTYPNAIPFSKYVPSWLKTEIRKARLKWGRVNDV